MQNLPNCFYRISVKALVLNETKDKFLVCKDHDYWELPGGGLEWDASPHTELAREIQEEMGVKVAWMAEQPSYFLTGVQTLNPEVKMANIIYECQLESLDFTPSEECTEIKFISAENVTDLPVFDSVEKLAGMFDPKNH